MKTLVFLLLCFLVHYSQGNDFFKKLYKDAGLFLRTKAGADVGEPLILTPFLEEGRAEEAQQAALVKHPQFGVVESYAGYFTVDKAFESNLWFWFFPSANNAAEDPVVLWLNGGPGVSSLNGLFDENGPFIVNQDQSVTLREYSWHKNQSVLFIDNPVGTGFSFTNGGLAQNETKVGEDLYSGLVQFFQLFPNLQKNDFFASGESYAGKYLPAIGYTILKKNPQAQLKINLKGLLIGDGWTDPLNQLNFGPFVYNAGLVSKEVSEEINEIKNLSIQKAQNGDWIASAQYSNIILNVIEEAANVNIYNYIKEYGDSYWPSFVSSDEIRKAIHVGDVEFGDKGAGNALSLDEMISVAPWVEELLEYYKVLVYTGQVDIIVGYPMVLDYLRTLNFTGVEEYHSSRRDIWYVDDEAAGYVRVGGNLVELLVRNAGHLVPTDQPKWAYDMLYKFTRNVPYA